MYMQSTLKIILTYVLQTLVMYNSEANVEHSDEEEELMDIDNPDQCSIEENNDHVNNQAGK